MTGCFALKPSYLVLSSKASMSHSWAERKVRVHTHIVTQEHKGRTQFRSVVPFRSTHRAAADDDLQLLCHDEVSKATLTHDQVEPLLESLELLLNADIEHPVGIQVHKLLQVHSIMARGHVTCM